MYGNSLGNAAAVPVGLTAATASTLPYTGFPVLTAVIIGTVLVGVGILLAKVRKPAHARKE